MVWIWLWSRNLLNKNHDPIDKYTVDFHEVGSLMTDNN